MQRGSTAIFTQLIVLASLSLFGTRAAPGDDDSTADQPMVAQPDTSTAPADRLKSSTNSWREVLSPGEWWISLMTTCAPSKALIKPNAGRVQPKETLMVARG